MDETTQQTLTTDSDPQGFARYRRTIKEHWFSYLLFLPTLLFLILLVWMPFVRGIWMSLHQWSFTSGEPIWVGLGNYTYLFEWQPFYTALKATIVFAGTTLLQLVLAITAALLVANLERFKTVVTGSFLIPYTMPPVATGTLWMFLLDPSLGPVFQLLQDWGILEQAIYWQSTGDIALAAVTLVTAWTFWPFMFLIILATLEGIPSEYYESAHIYGANRFQILRYITLPQLKSAILVAVSIRLVWNLGKVSQVLQMTGGGPGFDTSILAVFLYRFAYIQGELGLAFAVGIILLLLVFAFIIIFVREFENVDQGVGQ